MQDEIKITGVTVFVNPYSEPDEEEAEEQAKNEKKAEDEDNVCFQTLLLLPFYSSILCSPHSYCYFFCYISG